MLHVLWNLSRLFILAAAMCVMLQACSSKGSLESSVSSQPSAAEIEFLASVSNSDLDSLLQLIPESPSGSDGAKSLIQGLESLSWTGGEPASSKDVQPISVDEVSFRISSELGQVIKRLGELYLNETISNSEYTGSLLAIDALLKGVLASHKSIVNDQVSSLQSPLAYAALYRGAISKELRQNGLEDYAALSDENIAVLREIVRTQDFSRLEQVP